MTNDNNYQNRPDDDISNGEDDSWVPHVSNSTSIPPTSAPHVLRRNLDEVLGIDHLFLTFPVFPPGLELDHADRADFHNEGSVRSIRDLTLEVGGMTVSLRVAPARDGWRAKVWFNPSGFAGNPDPKRALPISYLPPAMGAVWGAVQEFAVSKVAMADAAITRIDVARDFKVAPTAQVALLDALHRQPVAYATYRPQYASTRGLPQSVYIGTKHKGMVRIYNRHAKDRSISEGTLRVEVEARKDWAVRHGGIVAVADLSPSSITDLFVNRFTWCGAGLPVAYEAAHLQRLWDLTNRPNPTVSPLEAVRFAGVERFQKAGVSVPEGNSTIRARNAMRAALGASHDSTDAPAVIRLDPAYDEALTAAA